MASFPPSRIVETAYGSVQGRRLVHEGEKLVDAFQGIPFAAPPVGELRFKKPVPPSKWSGVRLTTAFAARSIQHPKNPDDFALNGVPSEDSLYLNVFTPCWEAPPDGFPVMVFIHGGLYLIGNAKEYGDIGICENVVTRGVVFVTIQYRLGYLGFLSTGDSVCPGNFGLWDQVEALKWIQLNIGAFGGNKSAGAASVDLLHLSPHSTNLFHKAICMAGTAECRWAMHPEMKEQSLRKVERLGIDKFNCSDELLAILRKRPAEDFGVGLFTQVKPENLDMETGPCLDGDFLPGSLDALRKKATPKPFLIGITEEEGLLALAGRATDATGLELTLKEITSISKNKQTMKAELISRFVGSATPGTPAYMKAHAGMMSDAMFVAATIDQCRKTVEAQDEPVFLYVFEHYHPATMGYLAPLMHFPSATHTSELFYLFKKGLLGTPTMTETEEKVINTFTAACTNFARFGNPNGCDVSATDLPIRWQPITKSNPGLNYVITTGGAKISDELFEGRTADFIDIREKHQD